jgi:glycosyltransferase involved in cell wall biosynthesis
MKQKIKIFYHINLENNSAGGIINFLRGIVERFSLSYEVSYYSFDYGRDFILHSDIKQVYMAKVNGSANKKGLVPNNLKYLFSLFVFFILRKRNEDTKINKDDILVFNRVDHILPFIFSNGIKIIITHGSANSSNIYYRYKFLRRLYVDISKSLSLRIMNAIVHVSKDEFEYSVAKYPQYKEKFFYIPTFYDKRKFYRISSERNSKSINYIFTGRFVKEKGMKELAEYIDFLNYKKIEFQLTLIGEGEFEYLFQNKENVQIFNTMKQEDLRYHLNNNDIFLLFSHFEGTPLSLIEAMACGIPSITSKNGELKNLILDGYNGYSFKNISEGFEDILEMSIQIKMNFKMFSDNALKFSEKFELEKVCNLYDNLLKTLK